MLCNMKKGFTVIEVVVGLFIVVMLAAGAVAVFKEFKSDTDVSQAQEIVVSALRVARSRTLGSVGPSVYGAHFASTSATVFKGATYDVSSPDNEVSSLPSTSQISNISLTGGVSDVVFERVTGNASATGTITLSSTSDEFNTKTVVINESGLISKD